MYTEFSWKNVARFWTWLGVLKSSADLKIPPRAEKKEKAAPVADDQGLTVTDVQVDTTASSGEKREQQVQEASVSIAAADVIPP